MMPGKDKPDYETLLSHVWRKKVKLGKVWKHLGNVAPENHFPPTFPGIFLPLFNPKPQPKSWPCPDTVLEQLVPGGWWFR